LPLFAELPDVGSEVATRPH